MEKLKELINKCKCGVYLSVNEHKDTYETVEQYFEDSPFNKEKLNDIDEEVYKKMKYLDTMISIQYYPDSPNGFYRVYHYDIEKAIEEALILLN